MTVPRIVAASVGALSLFAIAGCAHLSEKRLDYTRTEHATIDQIILKPGSGSVTVHGGQVSEVVIKRVVRYRGAEPRNASYQIDGTNLTLDTDCGRQCSVSYEVSLPEGVPVRGENGSGDIELTQVGAVDVKLGSGNIMVGRSTGAVRTDTGSGDVTVVDAAGPVTMHTGSGTVNGRELGKGEIRAESGSGDITLALDSAGSVRAKAGSGSVQLSVPAGHYHVRADTGSGAKNVSVPDDPGSPLLLDLHTGSGDITVAQT